MTTREAKATVLGAADKIDRDIIRPFARVCALYSIGYRVDHYELWPMQVILAVTSTSKGFRNELADLGLLLDRRGGSITFGQSIFAVRKAQLNES